MTAQQRHLVDDDEAPEVCRDPHDEGCSELLDDGEGYDGCCGTCADRLEATGHWA